MTAFLLLVALLTGAVAVFEYKSKHGTMKLLEDQDDYRNSNDGH